MGAVPSGAKAKTILAGDENQEPGYYQTDPMANMARGLNKFLQQQAAEEEKRQKRLKDQFDMYKTLRDSGYDSKSAHEAIQKNEFPSGMPGVSTREQKEKLELEKTQAEIDKIKTDIDSPKSGVLQGKILNKIMNDETLTAGEQKIYDETIKHKGSDLESNLDGAYKNKYIATKEEIMAKVANNEELTTGEQKIYDDVISKKPGALDTALKNAPANKEETVPMISPDGTPYQIYKSKVNDALKKGFKKR